MKSDRHWSVRLGLSALRIAGVAYLGIVVVLYLLQSRYVYMPSRQLEATPASLNLPFEDVRFRAKDGTELHGWFVPAREPKGVILHCHGNAGNISHRVEWMALFHELGWSSFFFDYRGYGLSAGSPTEQGTYLDAEAAWLHLVEARKVPPGSIVVHGHSLGGTIAAWLAAQQPPRALILESTFTAVADVAAWHFPFLPVRGLLRFHYGVSQHLPRIRSPLLVVHSPEDEVIPFELGRRIFEAAPQPKQFLEIRGGHNDGFLSSGRRYGDGLAAFLAR